MGPGIWNYALPICVADVLYLFPLIWYRVTAYWMATRLARIINKVEENKELVIIFSIILLWLILPHTLNIKQANKC